MVVNLNKIAIVLSLFILINCKNNKNLKIDIVNKDSVLIIKKSKYDVNKNKNFLELIIFEKINYKIDNDFIKIKSVLLKTPGEINFTDFYKKINSKGIFFQSFRLASFLEYKQPFKQYYPFINKSNKKINFIISHDVNGDSLKISFKNGQYFWFGKKYKLITPKIKIKDKLDDHQKMINRKSFENPNFLINVRGGIFFEYNKKKYLLFIFNDGIWTVHHLFDITNDKNINYFILNSIYTLEDGYSDYNNDGKVDFKQKYYYNKNSNDTTQNKYKIYTIK